MQQELDLNELLAANVRALASLIRDMGGWLAELEERVTQLEKHGLVGAAEAADITLFDEPLVVLEGGGSVDEVAGFRLPGGGAKAHQPA